MTMTEVSFVIHSNNYYVDYCKIIDFFINTTPGISSLYEITITTSFFKDNDMMLKFQFIPSHGNSFCKWFSECRTRGIPLPRIVWNAGIGVYTEHIVELKQLKFFDCKAYENHVFSNSLKSILQHAEVDLQEHIDLLHSNYQNFTLCINDAMIKNKIVYVPYELIRCIYDALFVINGISFSQLRYKL